MKEGTKLLQRKELYTKGKVHNINFLDIGNHIMDFWEEKEIFFNAGSWWKDLFFSIYEACMVL